MDYTPLFRSLFTLGLLISAGIFSRRSKIFGPDDKKIFSSFVYNFGLPALFFTTIAQTDFSQLNRALFLGSILPLLIVFIGLLILHLFRLLSKDQFVLLGVSTVFGSHAFFGVAFFEALYGLKWLDLAVITAALLGMIGIVLSTLLFEYGCRKEMGWGFLSRVFKSPLIIAILGAGICSYTRMSLGFFAKSLKLIADTAAGVAIFSLGLFIHDNFSIAVLKKSFKYSFFRMVTIPLATVWVVFAFHDISPELKSFLLLQGGVPAAISIAIFAERYHYQTAEFSGIVVLTSLFSFIVLVLLFALTKVFFI